MRVRLLVIAMLAAACSGPPDFIQYQEPGGAFSAEVPKRWELDERGAFSRRPVGEVWWIGKVSDDHEGWPIGAIIYVRRMEKNPDKRNKIYIKWDLADTQALFTQKKFPAGLRVEKSTFLGFDAREFSRDYDEKLGGGWHGKVRIVPARAEGVVLDTPESYYVLEYRATKDLFDKYRYGFVKLKESFRLKGA